MDSLLWSLGCTPLWVGLALSMVLIAGKWLQDR